MADWIINGLTVKQEYGPFGLLRDGRISDGGKTDLIAYPLVGGGNRTQTSLTKKTWFFELRNVSTADADTIEDSIYSGNFTFHDKYTDQDYTVHATSFTGWAPYSRDKDLHTSNIKLEVV